MNLKGVLLIRSGLYKLGIRPMTVERHLEPLNAFLDFLVGAAKTDTFSGETPTIFLVSINN